MKTMKLTLSLVAALLLPLADSQAAKPLNILFFTADDMNCAHRVCAGPIKDRTPNLDRIQTDPTSDSSLWQGSSRQDTARLHRNTPADEVGPFRSGQDYHTHKLRE